MLHLPGVQMPLIGWVGILATVAFVVWMINLYNFMDGMDGLAGGMAIFGFGTFAVFGWLEGHQSFSVLSGVTAMAAAGFLVFNFPPARIFMGDVGSSTLGFIAAAFSLWGAKENVFPIWCPLLIFSPFILDATLTLLLRTIKGEKVWMAHRSHYYQRLACLNLGHRNVLLLQYGFMLGCAASAIASRWTSAETQWLILATWLIWYAGYFMAIPVVEGRRQQRPVKR